MDANNFDVTLGCLLEPSLAELATQLRAVPGTRPRECDVIVTSTRDALRGVLRRKLTRLLLLELNAARVTGRLIRASSAERWQEFLESASRRSYWDELAGHYPSMLGRLDTLVRNRCLAALSFARHWTQDRASLQTISAGEPGELQELSFGAGDSHCGGLTVVLARCEAGPFVYKPRVLDVDVALQSFIRTLAAESGEQLSIRVPSVVQYADHGWAEFIVHRYAKDEAELRSFYRGVGHWLAIMRLLGGSDLHSENLIAQGGSPVVVDCETLFTPKAPPRSLRRGQATDQATALVSGTVLNIGLLPGRASALIWRGVDNSGAGNLPGQQPKLPEPGIIQAGTDEAHLGTIFADAPVSQNHPSPQPALATHWPQVLRGFDDMTATLQRIDRSGRLRSHLELFSNCQVRVVARSTETYAEIARMLWHPVSLHSVDTARQRAYDLLARMAANNALAPSDPVVINAEIDDLMQGDIPFFTTRTSDGRLDGPRGTRWLSPQNLVDAAINDWRNADLQLERNVIRVAVVNAYVSDGGTPQEIPRMPAQVRASALETRRRRHAAHIVGVVSDHAIRGRDGTATWVAPVLGQTGWSVQPLESDLYCGISGVALLLGAYLREVAAGRADHVAGIDDLFGCVLRTLTMAEDALARDRKNSLKIRPPDPGGYIGLGSQIWARVVLWDWCLGGDDSLQRACMLADGIPDAVAADGLNDMLAGRTGAIVPLLALYRRTGDKRHLKIACEIGDQLCDLAIQKNGTAFWTNSRWPQGIGGFAHGVSGVGWALEWLGRTSGNTRHLQTAQAAFAFEDALWDDEERNWLDLRTLAGAKTAAAWCHGAVGIGLSRLDLDPELKNPQTRLSLRRAADATWRMGFGWTHSPCHGDTGAWELLDRAAAAGEAPGGITSNQVLAQILTSIEDHGLFTGLTRDAFPPGLMSGLGGIAYQLLRSHPDSALPSILTLGGGSF